MTIGPSDPHVPRARVLRVAEPVQSLLLARPTGLLVALGCAHPLRSTFSSCFAARLVEADERGFAGCPAAAGASPRSGASTRGRRPW